MSNNPPYTVTTADDFISDLSWDGAIANAASHYDPAEPVPDVRDCNGSPLDQSEVVHLIMQYLSKKSR